MKTTERSQATQQKLLTALHLCLKDKFFEHISIKELAEHAGVSVGTFYRRFKDKESLLDAIKESHKLLQNNLLQAMKNEYHKKI